jgi:DNA gyrase inhibitor GyrI
MDENPTMPTPAPFLEVEIRTLPDLRVLHRLLLFPSNPLNPDKAIRPAFKELHRQVSACGLDPDTLLHVGVPDVVEGELVSYDCCIEFPLPKASPIRMLPGGCYAVLIVEKTPAKIRPAIRSFRGDYLADHGLVTDEDRPVYEIYFKDALEYCLPIEEFL